MAQTNHSDELDQLLDSALDDFRALNLTSSVQRREYGVRRAEGSCLPKGLGLGLPDLSSEKKGKQKESHVLETLNKLREQTKETVNGLESIAAIAYEDDAMMEDWVKQFEELTCSQEVESMMETMMQQLLSKQVLHEPMKEIEEKYPKWLHDNKSKLDKKEYDRYLRQHQLMKDLNAVYESEPGNFNKITDLMQKMQECGQPPDDIVKEIAPDFDTSTLAHISPEMLASNQNCCIM